MTVLYIFIVVAITAVCCIGIIEIADYKCKKLEFANEQAKNVSKLTEDETRLEIEKEKTKQFTIKSDYREKYNNNIPEMDYELEITKEKTKQLEIKERCYKEHGERLYV